MSLASTTPIDAPLRTSSPLRPRRPRSGPIGTRRRRRRMIILLGAIMALCGVGGWLWLLYQDSSHCSDLETEVVRRGDLSMEITARGDLEPSEATDLFCRVKALSGNTFAATIQWLAAPGTWVKRGDLVVQLDDTPFQEDLSQRRVPLEQARSDWLQAIENQKMVVSQNESDIASAELALRLAEIDLKKYLEADYEQMRRDLLGQLKLAEANLLTAREHQAFTERMNRRGFSSDGQVRAERSRTNTIEMGVEALREQLAVLEKYGYPRDLADLRGKAAEARRAVDRAKEQ